MFGFVYFGNLRIASSWTEIGTKYQSGCDPKNKHKKDDELLISQLCFITTLSVLHTNFHPPECFVKISIKIDRTIVTSITEAGV